MQLLAGLWRTLNQGPVEDGERSSYQGAYLDHWVATNRRDILGWPQLITLFVEHLRGRISVRRQQLFTCAICNSQWDLSQDPRLVELVKDCENRADGLVDLEITAKAVEGLAEPNPTTCPAEILPSDAVDAVAALGRGDHINSLLIAWRTASEKTNPWAVIYHDLLEGILTPFEVEPEWLTWNGGVIPRLAQVIYDERRYAELMPVLADALEEAGCTSKALLEHCRSEGPHYLGCWAIDVLLGKN